MKAAVVLLVVLALAGCGGSSDRSSRIASEIGASGCSKTGFGIKNRIDGSKSDIYDCFVNGREMCVTEEGGIARDSTAVVRIVYRGTLGGKKPSCLEG